MNEPAITLRLAKSKLENEEGLNCLLVGWKPFGPAKTASLTVALPTGVKRVPNPDGFEEEADGRIVIRRPDLPDELPIEIYTEEAAPIGRYKIAIELVYVDGATARHAISAEIPLEIATEEDMVDLVVDKDIAAKIAAPGQSERRDAVVADACYDPILRRRRPFASAKPPADGGGGSRLQSRRRAIPERG